MFLVEILDRGRHVKFFQFDSREAAVQFTSFHNSMSVTQKAVHAW